jgi:hypothetical protein
MAAMTQDAGRRSDAAGQELFEGASGQGPRVIALAVAPGFRIRSPTMKRRPFEPLPPDDGRPAVLLPPLRAFIGPSGFALLAAMPLLLVASWQVALVAAVVAAASREIRRRADRMTFSFADGFLPYGAQTGWPQGVQEEDEVHWNWPPVRNGGAKE